MSEEPARRANWIVLALLGGVAVLLLLIAYFATNRNSDQDKLKDSQITAAQAPVSDKKCASQSTYELIKRELFRRAVQLRGSDQPAFDRIASFAVVRMDNPVLESSDSSTGAVNCSGSLSIDLPPGVAVQGGRTSLMSDIDYSVQTTAGAPGDLVQLRNADALITALATLSRVVPAAAPPPPTETPDANAVTNDTNGVAPAPETPPQQPPR